jgi:hypothetical protein
MFKALKLLFGKNRFAFIALLFFVLDVAYFFLLRSYNIEQRQALYETITNFILISFFSFILQRIHTYYHSRSAISIVHISIIFIFSFLCCLFLQEYGLWIGKKDAAYIQFLSNAFYLRWFILFLLFLAVDKHLSDQNNSLKRLVENEKQLAKAEINSLQQQFQPHFLFNSLNSISALVKNQPEMARSMIHNLSDYLRLTIQKGKEEFITIKEELDYLNLYLEIEKVRFGHRLTIQTELKTECESMKLPSLILQPILENAIKFGLYGNTGDLTISLSIECESENLLIKVTNPFDSETASTSKGTGYGIESVDRKLKLIFRRSDLLRIDKTNDLYTIQIQIPQK